MAALALMLALMVETSPPPRALAGPRERAPGRRPRRASATVAEVSNGGLRIAKSTPAQADAAGLWIRDSLANSQLRIDGRLVGDTPGRVIALVCRFSRPDNAYQFKIIPDQARWELVRRDQGHEVLLDWGATGAVRRGDAPQSRGVGMPRVADYRPRERQRIEGGR
jgi:hypothetical protein